MTTKMVELQEAQHHLLELIAQVVAGTEIILTDGQTPRARLIPLASGTTRRVAGLHVGSMTSSVDFDAPLPDAFWAGGA